MDRKSSRLQQQWRKLRSRIPEHDNERTSWKRNIKNIYIAPQDKWKRYIKNQPTSQAIYLRHKVGQHLRFRTLACLLTNPLSPESSISSSLNNKPRTAVYREAVRTFLGFLQRWTLGFTLFLWFPGRCTWMLNDGGGSIIST
jgi:hypothetical protein